MRSRRAWRCVCTLALLPLLACADDDSNDSSPCGDRRCPADCRALATGSCDVLQESCQERILDAVVCVRGTPGVLPSIRTLTEDEYRAMLAEDGSTDAGLDAGSDDAGVEPDAGATAFVDDARHWYVGLQLLGLLAPDIDPWEAAIDDTVSFLAGSYDSQEQRITLIDRGEPQDDWSAQKLMAHELVHALQDQTFGLPEFRERGPSSTDGQFAGGCLTEGDASLYGDLAWALLNGVSLEESYWDDSLAGELKGTRRDVLESVVPYTTMWQLRYPVGTRYLLDVWRDGGNWAVQSLFEAPPTSAIHWMIGFAENQARREHLVLPLACNRAAVPPGYERLEAYSLGAPVFFAFLGRALRDDGRFESEAHWRNAQHWRQDSFSLFVGPAGETAVSYRVRLDDAELADELAQAIANVSSGSQTARRTGDEIEVLAAEDPVVLRDWWTDPTACPAPE